jgi:hypothetical protein
MRTGCRGNGSFKREFIGSLQQRFETRFFTYQEAGNLPEFERRIFFSLLSDGYLKKSSDGKKSLYKISEQEISHR